MTPIDGAVTSWVVTTLLVALRLVPTLALAPPFSLVRVPTLARVALSLGLSGLLAASLPMPEAASLTAGYLVAAASRELLIGLIFASAFYILFGAIHFAGRTIDIQVGYGMAAVADPTTQAQTPLVGAIYAYATAAVFFAVGGHHELLRLWSASLEWVPLGQGRIFTDLGPLTTFMGLAFFLGLATVGGIMVALAIVDVGITLISRTAPQLNALVLGFQVKTIVLMIAMPLTLGTAVAVMARLVSSTLEAIPSLIA